MHACIFYGKGDVRAENIDVPRIGEGEVLLRVKAVGVCPTDVKAYYQGSKSISVPRIMGHEVTGVIEESKSNRYSKGDRVNVAADAPCLKCDRCARGLHNLCRNVKSLGVNVDGAYSEFMRVPIEFINSGMVIRLDNRVSFQEGTFMEPVAVSINAFSLVSPLNLKKAVIIGDGPNALIHLQLLKRLYKINEVYIIGTVKNRLDTAIKLGAKGTINITANNGDFSEIIGNVDLVDVTIGNLKALEEAMKLTDVGVRFVFFGGSSENSVVPLSINQIHYNQITVAGSTGTNLINYAEASRLVNSKTIDLEILVTKTFELNDIISAFNYSKELAGLKGIIIF